VEQPFLACEPRFIRRAVLRSLTFCTLPKLAEVDVQAAIDRVPEASQSLLIQAAEDAGLPDSIAVERLASLWVMAAAVNLADDLADGDCDYLPARVAPGVSFLLQALATTLAARGRVSAAGIEASSLALTRAAAGQSLEVRMEGWTAPQYLEVAELIAGQQYGAYFRLLWEGTRWEESSFAIGRDVGVVGIAMTDVASHDRRFGSMSTGDQALVLGHCLTRLRALEETALPSIVKFHELASATFSTRPPPEGAAAPSPKN
jgi:hypothetical protein